MYPEPSNDDLAIDRASACEPIGVEAPVLTWITVLANLQLALKHPENIGASVNIVRDFALAMIAHLESQNVVSPLIATSLRSGFNESAPVPGEPN